MEIILQCVIFIFAILYKIFLARNSIVGWILSIASGLLSFLYLLLYQNLPILVSLEISMFLLAIYGMYKHIKNTRGLTKIDWSIIGLTIIAISFLVFFQIRSNTVWYEIVASVSFLAGVVLIAQKYSISKIIGWVFFFIASLLYAKVLFDNGSYILTVVHLISMVIDIFAIYTILKKGRALSIKINL